MQISIFGTGYVGLVTGTCLAEHGHEVTCVDIDTTKITNLQQGILPIYEPGLQELVQRNTKEGRLIFTTDAQAGIEFGRVIFNAVGTPPDPDDNHKADLTYIYQVAETFGRHISQPKLLVNKSTVPVGTADQCTQIIQDELAQRGEEITFEVISNPEFLREGAAIKDFMNPDRVVCGVSSDYARAIMEEVYAPLMRSYRGVFFTDVRSAELIKYASNAFLATKISFINEIANFAELVWANISDIARGMGMDKRIGPKFLHAGIGYGGSCFPKDVQALIASGEEVNYSFEIIRAAEAVNDHQKQLPTIKLLEHLPELTDKTIGVWWLSFKPKTDDIRQAASLSVIPRLLELGVAQLQLFDPVAKENFQQVYPPSDQISYAPNPYEAANQADALLILTEREEFRGSDLDRLSEMMRGNIIIDGRNIREPNRLAEKWFVYEGVGN